MLVCEARTKQRDAKKLISFGNQVDKTYDDKKVLDTLGKEYDPGLEYDPEDYYDVLYNLPDNIRFLESSEDGAPKGKKIVGVLIAEISSEDSYLGENDVLIQGLLEEIDALKEKLNAKNSPTSIYTGTRCC